MRMARGVRPDLARHVGKLGRELACTSACEAGSMYDHGPATVGDEIHGKSVAHCVPSVRSRRCLNCV